METSNPSSIGGRSLCSALMLLSFSASAVLANDWSSWRGPLQTGASLEKYSGADGKLIEEPVWTYDSKSRGCPVVFDGRVFSFGYRGEKEELVELLTCLDEETGEVLWEVEIKDFISDTVYNRYAIGSPTVDPETKKVYLMTAYGVFGCWDFDGNELWRHSMMEKVGRLTFPNSKVGAPVIEGDLVIVRGIISFWGATGPAADRFFGFDKESGELVWTSTPGTIPPKDSSFSNALLETRDNKRVFYSLTGCGNIVCANALTGEPLWRYKIAKVGANASPLIHGGDKVIAVHGDENVDTTERGRMVAVKLPETFGDSRIEIDPAIDEAAWNEAEIWRARLSSGSGSPVLVGDSIYQITDTASVVSVNANTGEIQWEAKVSNGNTHSSPVYADGYVYAPLMEGSIFVIKADSGEVVQKVELDGNCIGAAAICNGHLLVHTTNQLYRFKIGHDSMTVDEAPVVAMPEPGEAAALQIVPSEFVLFPGDSQKFQIRTIDANGLTVGEVESAEWSSFVPPTAKVKAEVDGSFNDAGELAAGEDAKLSAGAFKATSNGLEGILRGRLLMKPPFTEDFNSFELTETQEMEGVNFAYPPLPWIGARFKFDVRELDGEKVFAKTFDRLLFQRATVFIGTPDMSDYTMQADVMTDGNRRVKSDVGVINQRYAFVLKGNANQLEITSNFERLTRSAPFRVEANTWYTLKSQVLANEDGTGIVRGKVWVRGEPEPEEWTVTSETLPIVHQSGSPGLFGFTPQNQKKVFIDNVKVTPNE